MMDMSFTSMIPKMKEEGIKVQNETDSLITGFFFGLAPIIFSIILGEKWAEFHSIDYKEGIIKKSYFVHQCSYCRNSSVSHIHNFTSFSGPSSLLYRIFLQAFF